MSFVASVDFVSLLKRRSKKSIIVCDGFKSSQDIVKVRKEGSVQIWAAPRHTVGNIESSFHPKLALIKFSKSIRIFIGTGNFFTDDWNKYANAFWMKDYRFIINSSISKSSFANYLEAFCATCLGKSWMDACRTLDLDIGRYCIDSEYFFPIASFPSTLASKSGFKTGLDRFEQVLYDCPPIHPYSLENTKLSSLTSSVNSINSALLYDLTRAIMGNHSINWAQVANDKSLLLNAWEILYPSQRFVEGSHFGESGADCLFLRKTDFERAKFEKSPMRKYATKGRYQGCDQILPHLKLLVVRHGANTDDDTLIYVGSHNLTKAAWGNRDVVKGEYFTYNFELGVLLPPWPGSKRAKIGLLERMNVNFDTASFEKKDQPFFSDQRQTMKNVRRGKEELIFKYH